MWIEGQRFDAAKKIELSRCFLRIHEEDKQFLPQDSFVRNVRLAEKNGRGLRAVTQVFGVKPQVPGSLLDDAVQAAREPDDDLAHEYRVLVGVPLAEYRVPVIERDLQVYLEGIERCVLLFPDS